MHRAFDWEAFIASRNGSNGIAASFVKLVRLKEASLQVPGATTWYYAQSGEGIKARTKLDTTIGRRTKRNAMAREAADRHARTCAHVETPKGGEVQRWRVATPRLPRGCSGCA